MAVQPIKPFSSGFFLSHLDLDIHVEVLVDRRQERGVFLRLASERTNNYVLKNRVNCLSFEFIDIPKTNPAVSLTDRSICGLSA